MKLENFDLTKTKEFRTWMKEADSQEQFVNLVRKIKDVDDKFFLGYFPGKDCVLVTSQRLLAGLLSTDEQKSRNLGWLEKLFDKAYDVNEFLEKSAGTSIVIYKQLHGRESGVIFFTDSSVEAQEVKGYYTPKFGRTKFLIFM